MGGWIDWLILFLIILIFGLVLALYTHLLPKNKVRWRRFFFSRDKTSFITEYESFIYQLSHALHRMSQGNIGALIIIEKKDDLNKYIALGYSVRAKLTSEFLINIFWNKKSALHDGGVIVRAFDIVSVSSYFPVTQSKMTQAVGARHRAASGLTEETDSIAFVVSETTGEISVSQKGKLENIDHSDENTLCEKIFATLYFYMDLY